jgi:thioredoxin 1
MLNHLLHHSRRRRWAVALSFCWLLVGCGLADKKRPDLAQKPVEQDRDEEAAPIVLASDVDAADRPADAVVHTPPSGEVPRQPRVIPAGAISPSDQLDAATKFQPDAELTQEAPPPKRESSPVAERKVLAAGPDDFQDVVLESDEVVLVDFYADWCGPCKKQAPILEQFAKNQPDVRVVKVNMDKNRRVAKTYGVRRLPTLMVFRDGKPIEHRSGLTDEATLKKLVEQAKTR